MAVRSLTAARVRDAKPNPSVRLEIGDGSGLYLVVQPTGGKSWALRYRDRDKPKKLTLGPVFQVLEDGAGPTMEPHLGKPLTLAQARLLASRIQHQMAMGQPPPEPATRKIGEVRELSRTFSVVAEAFLQRYALPNTRLSTLVETTRSLGFSLIRGGGFQALPAGNTTPVESWRDRDLALITKRDINYVLDKVSDERGGHAANAVLAAVRRLFNWAVEQDIISGSPCLGVKKRLIVTERDRVLTDEELRLVWLAAQRIGWPYGHLVQILALTGCRRDEWAQARWSELDINSATFSLPADRSKNRLRHILPLSRGVLDILSVAAAHRLAGEPDWIFTTGFGRTSTLTNAQLVPFSGFAKAKVKLDEQIVAIKRQEAIERGSDPEAEKPIANWRLHDLRRTFVTGLAALHVPMEVIEKSVNHVSGSFSGVVRVYQKHRFAGEMREALSKWSGYVDELINSSTA